MERRASSARPVLCAVLDGTDLGAAPRALARTLFEAGVDWIQLRDRSLEARPLAALARGLVEARDDVRRSTSDPERRAGGPHAPLVVVNKRVDVALAVLADGVHLGIDALEAVEVRRLWSTVRGEGERAPDERRPRIGASIHAPGELEAAIATQSRLDYVHLAPIWNPRSKPAERPALGLEPLAATARIAARSGLLVLAQGGLDVERAGECVAAGAAGIAVTGVVRQASDPRASAEALRLALDRSATRAAGSAPGAAGAHGRLRVGSVAD